MYADTDDKSDNEVKKASLLTGSFQPVVSSSLQCPCAVYLRTDLWFLWEDR